MPSRLLPASRERHPPPGLSPGSRRRRVIRTAVLQMYANSIEIIPSRGEIIPVMTSADHVIKLMYSELFCRKSPMNDTPTARRRHILELLDTRRMLTVQELAEELGVSAMTVHRDLGQAGRRRVSCEDTRRRHPALAGRRRSQRGRCVRHVQPSRPYAHLGHHPKPPCAAVCAHVARIAAWLLSIWVNRPT